MSHNVDYKQLVMYGTRPNSVPLILNLLLKKQYISSLMKHTGFTVWHMGKFNLIIYAQRREKCK